MMGIMSHRARLKSAGVYILIILTASSYLYFKSYHKKATSIAYDFKIFNNGDLISRKGHGIFSDIFSSIGKGESPYSHVGIINKINNEVFVIHTEANEITGIGFAKEDCLIDFINNASSAALYRVKRVSSNKRQSIVLNALRYVRDKIPFDTDFDLSSDNKLYCTELVYKAFRDSGLNILGSPSIIRVSLFGSQINKKVITIEQLLEQDALELITKLR